LQKNYRQYAAFMRALADETRISIFNMLTEGELCACKILEDFRITQPTLSYHMKILCDSGLVRGRKDGIWMKYTINPDSLEAMTVFFNEIRADLKTQTESPKSCTAEC